jgi:PAS domain S-box-containing protein
MVVKVDMEEVLAPVQKLRNATIGVTAAFILLALLALLAWLGVTRRQMDRELAEGRRIRELNESLEQRVRERTAQLRESEERLRLMTNSVKDYAIIMLDPRGRVVTWNEGARRLKGYAEAEILGQSIERFYSPEEVAAGKSARLIELAAAEGRCEDEGWRVRKDGTRFFADVVLTAMRDQAGELVGFAKITRDITERRRVEEEIRRLNADLERRVEERTQALEEANRELASFSYSVSHDLRAPLRHIAGYGEMLAKSAAGQLSDKAQRYLKTILDTSSEMGRLIDDLLAFSRMGQAQMRQAGISLNDLVREVLGNLEMATRGRDIAWTIAALPAVTGDASMLRQVFVNLLDNAVKYSRGREPAKIEVGCAGQEEKHIILYVRDNGVGFDMQYAGKLFGVFQRLHRAEEFEGAGVGLATVRRIITRHGGRVWAEARPGYGATFYFTLKPATANSP